MLLLSLIIFGIALFVLIKGADFFLEGAASIAKILGISEFIIGLSIVALGTSLPELGAALAAAYYNSPGLIIGNIIGSNIANIGLILGIAAMRVTISVSAKRFKEDILFLMVISILFFLLSIDGILSLIDGLVLILLLVFYLRSLVQSQEDKNVPNVYLEYMWKVMTPTTYTDILDRSLDIKTFKVIIQNYRHIIKDDYIQKYKILFKKIILTVLGIVLLLAGANYLITSASSIALSMGVPDTVIGLVFIAIGTSLPELTVTLTSLKKGMSSILIGNIIGSNILNLLLIGGVSSMLSSIAISRISLLYNIPVMILMVVLLFFFIRSDSVIRIFEGFLFFLIYILFIISVFLL